MYRPRSFPHRSDLRRRCIEVLDEADCARHSGGGSRSSSTNAHPGFNRSICREPAEGGAATALTRRGKRQTGVAVACHSWLMESDSHQEWLDSWHPRPAEERTFAPASVAPWICPGCAGPATVGVRVGGPVNVRCEADGTWYAVAPFSFNRQELLVTAPRPRQMNSEARFGCGSSTLLRR